ncbi:MAG: histone deacetylase [Pseudomonadota bacterium]
MAITFYYPNTPPLPLPPGHRFPAGKYALLKAALLKDEVIAQDMLRPSTPASTAELARAHDPAYVAAVANGTVSDTVQRRIGLPWSQVLADRSRATVGGSLIAARSALKEGISGQLAGGTHHAHYAEGSGYCTFNDLAVTALSVLDEGLCRRIAILDTDVHQGDGNAALLAQNPAVFVCSLHGAKNFPFRKVPSDLDFDLPDGTEDRDYLRILADALAAIDAFRPELLLFLSGADCLADDKLGRLSLSLSGMTDRDLMVFEFAARRALPLSIAIGGGYADPIALSVAAYANTLRAAKSVYRF